MIFLSCNTSRSCAEDSVISRKTFVTSDYIDPSSSCYNMESFACSKWRCHIHSTLEHINGRQLDNAPCTDKVSKTMLPTFDLLLNQLQWPGELATRTVIRPRTHESIIHSSTRRGLKYQVIIKCQDACVLSNSTTGQLIFQYTTVTKRNRCF